MEFQYIGSHSDVVNDISFDFYGRRFATCSSDKHIRIWDMKDEDNGEEKIDMNSDELRRLHNRRDVISNNTNISLSSFDIPSAHQNAIWRLSWAHPEFGQLLASCSDDHTICIWEEVEMITRGEKQSAVDEAHVVQAGVVHAQTPNATRATSQTQMTMSGSGPFALDENSYNVDMGIVSTSADLNATSIVTANSRNAIGIAKNMQGSDGLVKTKIHTFDSHPLISQSSPLQQQSKMRAQQVSSIASRSRWTKKAQLSESKKAVRDVKFAPRHLGLMLASASADGIVRVYEATDVFSLNIWQLQHSVQVEQMVDVLVVDIASSSSSSNSASGFIASGSAMSALTATTTGVTPAVVFGAHSETMASQASTIGVTGKSEQGLTCLSWNTCPFESAKLAVGGYSCRAVVLSLVESKWVEECVLGEHTGVVHDIAWAPTMGRNYHQIATASRESIFRVHTLNRSAQGTLVYRSTQMIEATCDVWRVAWNATGTVLATSSEDGTLALWRKDYNGEWKNVQTLPVSAAINWNEETRAFYRI